MVLSRAFLRIFGVLGTVAASGAFAQAQPPRRGAVHGA